MDIGFAIHRSEEVDNDLFLSIEQSLNSFLFERNYGNDLKKIVIGIYCLKEEFEEFYRKRNPKFTRYKEIKVVDRVIVLDKVFEYELWLSFKKYQPLTKEGKYSYVTREILNSLTSLNFLPKSVKDFDKARFKSDLEIYFAEQNYPVGNKQRQS